MSWHKCPFPECNKPVRVLDTRFHENGYVRRRYKCLGEKQHRFTTSEVLVPWSKRGRKALPKHAAAAVARTQRKLEKIRLVIYKLGQLLNSEEK